MALLRATVSVEYETDDAAELMAQEDARSLQEDPLTLVDLIDANPDTTEIRVEVVTP